MRVNWLIALVAVVAIGSVACANVADATLSVADTDGAIL